MYNGDACWVFLNFILKKCRAPWFKTKCVKGSNTYASYSHARFKCTPKMPLILLFKSWIPCIYACVMSNELTRQVVMKFLPPQSSWIWYKCLQRNFIHSKIFLSDQIQRAYHKKSNPDYYTCRNADSNFIIVVATTKRFFFSNNWFIYGIYQGMVDLVW